MSWNEREVLCPITGPLGGLTPFEVHPPLTHRVPPGGSPLITPYFLCSVYLLNFAAFSLALVSPSRKSCQKDDPIPAPRPVKTMPGDTGPSVCE